jgi:hypothetical protein
VVDEARQNTPKEEKVTLTPSSGEGQITVFTVTLSPAEVVRNVNVLYSSAFEAANSCYVSYNPEQNRFGLANDPADRFQSLSTEKQIENGQCVLAGFDKTRGEIKNNLLALSLPITFKNHFEGPKNIYVYVQYKDGRKPTMHQEGTWLVAP